MQHAHERTNEDIWKGNILCDLSVLLCGEKSFYCIFDLQVAKCGLGVVGAKADENAGCTQWSQCVCVCASALFLSSLHSHSPFYRSIFTIIPNGVVGMFISNLIWWMKWNRGFCLKSQMENFWTVAIFQEYEAIKLKLWLLNGNERWLVKMLPRFHLWPLLNFAKCHTREVAFVPIFRMIYNSFEYFHFENV